LGALVDVTDSTAGANLEPDPGLANHLIWLVNFGCSNDVRQKSRSSPVGVGYHPSTKNNGDSVEANVGPS
jgi:hypothetical protein